MKRSFLCVLSAFLLMGTLFRLGYQVEVDGEVLPGIYDPKTVKESARLASLAAEEICRGTEEPPFRLVPVLCARYTAAEDNALTRAMLEAYDGVSALYAVYSGQIRVGTTEDPGLPGTIYDERMASQMMTGMARHRPLTMRRVYTYPEAVTGVMEMSRAMGQAVLY